MAALAIIVTILAAATGLEWLLRNALALKVWGRAFHLTPDYPADESAGHLPRVSIVVAAKDEQDNVAACVGSLLAQDYPDFELTVVDDRSTDATARIVQDLAAEDSRLTLVQVGELPAGWCGKNHAMQRGIERSDGEWIFMTDADCTYASTRTLRVAVAVATRTGVDMLSVLPELTMGSFWERLLLPVCAGVLMIWFPPRKVNDPRRRHAYANGMFMLIRRGMYERIGTHEAFKGSLIEDMDLARAVKAAGGRLQVAQSEGLLSVRMYTSRRQLVRGWVRIFLGAFRTSGGLAKALAVLLGRGLTPLVTTVVGATMALFGAEPAQWWTAAAAIGAVALMAQLVMTSRYYAYARTRWTYGLLYPFACSAVGAVLLRTMFSLRRGAKIVWRDTVYNARPK